VNDKEKDLGFYSFIFVVTFVILIIIFSMVFGWQG